MTSTFGERASSHAMATCTGLAPTRCATVSSTADCSGVISPMGKNDV